MKHLLPILIFPALLVSFSSFGQTPDYFGNDPKWSEEFLQSAIPGETDGFTQRSIYYIDGTETFGEYDYHIVKRRSQITFFGSGEMTDITYVTRMHVRQEGRNIYFLEPESEQDSLFISYEMEIGDDFTGYYGVINSTETVAYVDSIMVGDTYRRRFYTGAPATSSFLIEGIGHLLQVGPATGGYFGNTDFGEEGIGFDNHLECYSENTTTLWTSYLGAGCQLSLSTPENELNSNSFTIYPNPALNTLTIDSEARMETIQITALDGKVVLKKKVNAFNEHILIDELNTGIYVLSITDSKGTISQKKFQKR